MDELLSLLSTLELEKSEDEIKLIISDAIILYNIYIQQTIYIQENIKNIDEFNIKQKILDSCNELKKIENNSLSIKVLKILENLQFN